MHSERLKTNQNLFSIHFHNMYMENIDNFVKESMIDMKGKERDED